MAGTIGLAANSPIWEAVYGDDYNERRVGLTKIYSIDTSSGYVVLGGYNAS